MELYLVRHPSTIRNVNKKLTGWEKTNYSKEGKKQFEKILSYFKKNNINYPIYSSDLPRALKLAKAISNKIKNKLHISKFLREKNLKETKPYGCYETNEEFRKRVLNFFNRIKTEKIILVSHSGVIRVILNDIFSRHLKKINLDKDRVLLIETNKKRNRLKIINV